MGHEKTLTGLIAALAGANLIYGPGMLGSGITFDIAQLVLDAEFVRMIKHTLKGFLINDETLAADVIEAVGPAKDFLTHDHTFQHMRTQSQPELIDRREMEDWLADGGLDSYARAQEKARRIVDHHKVQPLGADVRTEIQAIIRETEDELGVSGK